MNTILRADSCLSAARFTPRMDCAYSIDGYKSKSADHPAKTLYTAITAHFHADTAVIACRPCPSTGQGGDLARTCIVFPLLSIYRPQEFYTIEDKAIS